jgi:hypothetical protein
VFTDGSRCPEKEAANGNGDSRSGKEIEKSVLSGEVSWLHNL